MSKFVQNLEKFKLITFDLTGTLLKFKRPPGIEYAETAKALGMPKVDPDKIAAQFPSSFKQMYSDYPNFGRNKMSWETWWEKLIFNVFQSAGTTLNKDDLYRLTTEFDFVVGSYEVGAAKPDPRIFDVAIKFSNFNAFPCEALHIGNTPALDYIAAKEAGWTSVLITNGKNDWLLHKDEISEKQVFESLVDFRTKLENVDIQWEEPLVK